MDVDSTPHSLQDVNRAKRQRTGSVTSVCDGLGKAILQNSVPMWQTVSEGAFGGIVSIRFNQPVNFDTNPPMCSEATGFIVDAKRGIILTNRHVVGSGPFVGEAIMHDHEEVSVKAIYRDPIHDFGFLQFDPSKVKYMKLVEIRLAPENARVGIDVRVIGNDAGEKLSILAGSISRVDRNVPEYGTMTYNDLNTFYLQAASSLSGGSSGSPVIDINGDAIALQAGGRSEEATNYFLPLDRVKRALEMIQAGKPVLRGSMQTLFTYVPFDEVRRMGLPEETEVMVRKIRPEGIGMLVVRTLLPEGPGEVAGIEEGDVLISINGEVVTHFVPLEEYMDDNIGGTLVLQVARDKKIINISVKVDDMHALTPSQFVTFGGGVVHDFSYQLAYTYNLPVRGVFVASAVDLLQNNPCAEGVIIDSIDSKPIRNIEDFVSVMKTIPDRASISLEHYSIEDVHTRQATSMYVVHQWHKMSTYSRNDNTGLWDCERIKDFPKAREISPIDIRFPTMDNENAGKAAQVSNSIVMVRSMFPVNIDGVDTYSWTSYGVVVDAEHGLVVVSQRTVMTSICELTITIAGSCIIPAKLRFLHPTLNFAIVQYDPRHIGDTDIRAASISKKPLRPGDATRMITHSRYSNPLCINTVVTETVPLDVPLSESPKWRSINAESILLESPQAQHHAFGVLADDEGKAQALWLAYMHGDGKRHKYAGMPIQAILPALEPLQRGEEPRLRSLNIEVTMLSIAKAVSSGLNKERLSEYQKTSSSRNMMFQVARVETLSKAFKVLKELDIIISINGKPMKSIDDLDVQYSHEKLEIVVLRRKKELTLQVETSECNRDTEKVVFWAGATFQAPHKAVLQQSRTAPSGIYCTSIRKGSPAEMYTMSATFWVTHVNGEKTPDLGSFERAVRVCPDNTYVRIRVMSFDSAPLVLSIKMCYHYWPTSTLTRDSSSEGGWRSEVVCGSTTPSLINSDYLASSTMDCEEC
ncbi:hypothetical protein BX661DRAFT_175407 [Kickxella alabastrina]|uniref:uncharacterized protein n=1 Tax=Kickxella alabastrina TaxID=61397 RepID=UPI00221F9427|nr:uncharacterized protein BX661DRAFT_175407 [Kickxella alabastrina]KAI7834727.1 hypothetical protein BX661DRAFT_175407 [Kickxella alabastrina]KAJ1947431.1 hypothetical protein GGF37_000371 [Kickxella alabastrina]